VPPLSRPAAVSSLAPVPDALAQLAALSVADSAAPAAGAQPPARNLLPPTPTRAPAPAPPASPTASPSPPLVLCSPLHYAHRTAQGLPTPSPLAPISVTSTAIPAAAHRDIVADRTIVVDAASQHPPPLPLPAAADASVLGRSSLRSLGGREAASPPAPREHARLRDRRPRAIRPDGVEQQRQRHGRVDHRAMSPTTASPSTSSGVSPSPSSSPASSLQSTGDAPAPPRGASHGLCEESRGRSRPRRSAIISDGVRSTSSSSWSSYHSGRSDETSGASTSAAGGDADTLSRSDMASGLRAGEPTASERSRAGAGSSDSDAGTGAASARRGRSRRLRRLHAPPATDDESEERLAHSTEGRGLVSLTARSRSIRRVPIRTDAAGHAEEGEEMSIQAQRLKGGWRHKV